MITYAGNKAPDWKISGLVPAEMVDVLKRMLDQHDKIISLNAEALSLMSTVCVVEETEEDE